MNRLKRAIKQLLRKTRKSFQRLSYRLAPTHNRTVDHWTENTPDSEALSDKMYWLAVPAVKQRYNHKATGGRDTHWAHYFLEKYLSERPGNRMVSVGCGTGLLERELASWDAFEQCDAFDLAPGAIKKACQLATDAGITNINYAVCDINTYTWPENYYDAVWFNHSLHHIERLESVYAQLVRTLKPGGFLFFNEYVGPNRFNFTPRQKEVISAVFHLMPVRFKRSFIPTYQGYMRVPPLPDPVEVQMVDPSESVRSSEIMPLLSQYFDVLECNKTGGTLLQFLLAGTAGNFREDDPDSMQALEMLFNIEDTLIDMGDLESDFVCVAAVPKKAP